MEKTVILFVAFKRIKGKNSAVFKTSLNLFVFWNLIQEWSTNKLKQHTVFWQFLNDLQRTVGPFSLQDTEYTWFKDSQIQWI